MRRWGGGRGVGAACVIAGLGCALGPAAVAGQAVAGQAVAGVGPSGHWIWSSYPGVYELESGERVVVFDVVDQMPDGSHQLVLIEEGSGRARTLYPAVGDGPGPEFREGPGWFHRDPVERRVRFAGLADGVATRIDLTWVDSGPGTDSGRVVAERVAVRTVDVRIPAGDVTLAGELILPPEALGSPPYPAVQFISGGGPLTRRSPRHMGQLLAARGVAALVLDKRGTGESTGVFRGATLADFGADALAAHRYLRGRPEVDASRIGFWAGSEGGLVSWYVLPEVPTPAVFVCRVCPVLPYAETLPDTRRSALLDAGLPRAAADSAAAFLAAQARYAVEREGYEEMAAIYAAGEGSPWRRALNLTGTLAAPDADSWGWYEDFLRPDPRDFYRTLDAPIYILLGEDDERIPSAPTAAAARTVLAGRDVEWHVEVVDGGNHGLMVPRPDVMVDDAPVRHGYPPGMLAELMDWVAARVRR